MKELGEGLYRLVLRYGFMQGPNIPSELDACARLARMSHRFAWNWRRTLCSQGNS
jgi:hypothetical protein